MPSAYKIASLVIFLLAALTASAQNETVFGKYNVLIRNESGKTAAQFPGGKDSLKKFTFENLKIERKGTCSHPNNIQVKFIVEKTGEITHINYIKPGDVEAYKETLRFIRSMPKWTPATVNDTLTSSMVLLQFYR